MRSSSIPVRIDSVLMISFSSISKDFLRSFIVEKFLHFYIKKHTQAVQRLNFWICFSIFDIHQRRIIHHRYQTEFMSCQLLIFSEFFDSFTQFFLLFHIDSFWCGLCGSRGITLEAYLHLFSFYQRICKSFQASCVPYLIRIL